jgi:hypothetical protein
MTGVYPQRLRGTSDNVPRYIAARLLRSLRQWQRYLTKAGTGSERSAKNVEEIVKYYERELEAFRKRWPRLTRERSASTTRIQRNRPH